MTVQRLRRLGVAFTIGLFASLAVIAPAAADENMECSPGAIIENHEGCSTGGNP